MSSQKLFLFDFDGVIVDGMNEYWHSSLLAFDKFLNSPDIYIDKSLYKKVSRTFIEMRPWVKYGWEMLIIVHQIIKKENPLNNTNKTDFLNKYHQNCQKVLLDNSWVAEDLQRSLDAARKYQIDKDFDNWIKLHIPFYEVIDFIEKIKKENIKTGIITTKGKIFAGKIIKKLNIVPELIFGYEAGTKVEIASQLSNKYEIMGFLEDRRNTLIDIKQNTATKNIPCYLADWGYLKNIDKTNLPYEIKLLKLKSLKNLLAI
ncbi:Predicted phosphatase [Prochlorococcus marinus str. MIT 9515]|uniref:Predicted phosphatase n=1 Tax=Prochlorococcus marinus (strain MIT 9515) TaxID=167542 RepID=A2BYT9_PROM5|nr:HAD family hydrolase [Prochlorococcus marinus]ABM72950.1 Predicted phosphatase [Prochlorococcus marinus str. MIT 9515]